MRKWKVETPETERSYRKEETIEAEEILPVGQYVAFYDNTENNEYGGGRFKAVRMNANVTEITEEEK